MPTSSLSAAAWSVWPAPRSSAPPGIRWRSSSGIRNRAWRRARTTAASSTPDSTTRRQLSRRSSVSTARRGCTRFARRSASRTSAAASSSSPPARRRCRWSKRWRIARTATASRVWRSSGSSSSRRASHTSRGVAALWSPSTGRVEAGSAAACIAADGAEPRGHGAVGHAGRRGRADRARVRHPHRARDHLHARGRQRRRPPRRRALGGARRRAVYHLPVPRRVRRTAQVTHALGQRSRLPGARAVGSRPRRPSDEDARRRRAARADRAISVSQGRL